MGIVKFFVLSLIAMFFILMLTIPNLYVQQRGVFLVILLVILSLYLSIRSSSWKMHRWTLFWGAICLLISMLGIWYGVLKDAPGALRVGTTYIVWPVVYLFLSCFVCNPAQLSFFFKLVIAGALCASLMSFLVLFELRGDINLGILKVLEGDVDRVLEITENGFARFSLSNLPVVMYSVPFFASVLFLDRFVLDSVWWYFLSWIGFVLAVAVTVISGRRAVWLVAIVTPAIVYVFIKLCNTRARKNAAVFSIYVLIIFLCAILFVFELFDLDFVGTYDAIMTGFDFTSSAISEGPDLRKQQFIALSNGIAESPLFGHGHGSFSRDSIRSVTPWLYELTYIAMVFQVGIVGAFIYGLAVMSLYFNLIRYTRKYPEVSGMTIPLMSGMTGFFIANATNPYLASFDFLWVLFLPVMFLNVYLLEDLRLSLLAGTLTHAFPELYSRPST